MSLATWKKQYYPVPADRVPRKEAVAASLLKWRGLTPAALRRHRLKKMYRVAAIHSSSSPFEEMCQNIDTCSLCQHYWGTNCNGCPLMLLRMRPCYSPINDSFPVNDSPYTTWSRTGDARPMIRLLRQALKQEKTSCAS